MSYRAFYAIYKKKSKKKLQIAFIIDLSNNSLRKSSFLNSFEIISERNLCALERYEMDANKNSFTRRFIVWYYKDIEFLIEEDLKYELQTPGEFISICKKLGYTKERMQ
jgi:hypothetical protein